MTPLGNTFRPPDPSAGVDRLSSILGLAQQKQNLQTGQYTQQTAQAESKLAQQKQGELKAAQQLAIAGAKSGDYTLPDGSLNRQKMADDITKVAPTFGNEMASTLLSQANEVVHNQQAHQAMSRSQQEVLSNTFQALAGKPDLSNSDIIDALDAVTDQFKDQPGFKRMALSMLSHLPGQATPDQLRQITGQWAAAGRGETVGIPTTRETPTGVTSGTTNRFTGGFSPSGPTFAREPGAAQVAQNDVDRGNQVSAAVKPANAAIELSTAVDDLAEQIHSGKISQAVSDLAGAIGISPIAAARQVLKKDLGQLKTIAGSSAKSDERLQTILSGYPDDSSAAQTIHTAMDYIRGTFRQDLARGKNLDTYRSKKPDLSGFQKADDSLMSKSEPLMHEYLALPKGQARVDFFRRNFTSKEAGKAFRDKAEALGEDLGGQ